MADKRLKLKKGVLSVEGMHFYSYHGCSPEETLIGADYFVDVKIKSDYSSAIKEDELKNTFDYTTIYNLVKAEMNIPSKLIEHVAGRIANSLQSKLSGFKKLTVILKKINPPVNGNIAQSMIKLVYKN